jgi:hypothetical protein
MAEQVIIVYMPHIKVDVIINKSFVWQAHEACCIPAL